MFILGDNLKIRLVVATGLALLLSACSGADFVVNSPTSTPKENLWLSACEEYQPRGKQEHLIVYQEIIESYCKEASPHNFDLNYEASSTVDKEDLAFHLDSEQFFLSYWSSYMGDVPKKIEYIFTNKDKEWWTQKQVESLSNPDLAWFTSTTEGGHCRVDPFIYCSKLFEPSQTSSGSPVEFRIIGTSFRKEYWQLTNIAHETVHLYQDSHGMSHWSPWYVEGQATVFELAAGELLFGNNELRSEYFNRLAREDRIPFNYESGATVYQHFLECGQTRNGECSQFFYGVAALYHEKLILDHGLKKYFEWQTKLQSQMPKGNPSSFSQEQTEEMVTKFASIFETTFKYSLVKFETEVAPNYVSEQFLQAADNNELY